MNDPRSSSFDSILRADAEEVARRTLRHKFGRLSNRRILTTLRTAEGSPAVNDVPDGELLDTWFAEYTAALRRLRAAKAS